MFKLTSTPIFFPERKLDNQMTCPTYSLENYCSSSILLTYFKNSLVIHEGNTKQIHFGDGDFIPDKTYILQAPCC